MISSLASKDGIANLFAVSGWNVRRCSWVDYELTSSFAELILEGEGQLLLHGTVSKLSANVKAIASVLRDAGLAFSLECYASDGTLLAEITEQQNGG
jgi:hypothetical protein